MTTHQEWSKRTDERLPVEFECRVQTPIQLINDIQLLYMQDSHLTTREASNSGWSSLFNSYTVVSMNEKLLSSMLETWKVMYVVQKLWTTQIIDKFTSSSGKLIPSEKVVFDVLDLWRGALQRCCRKMNNKILLKYTIFIFIFFVCSTTDGTFFFQPASAFKVNPWWTTDKNVSKSWLSDWFSESLDSKRK